ncbi:hypothetical protein Tco_0673458, partial [Tanacetum coccineum]
MSDKKDEINKKNEQDWNKVERTQDLVEYVNDKYVNVSVTNEMLNELYNFAMMKGAQCQGDLSERDTSRAKEAGYENIYIKRGLFGEGVVISCFCVHFSPIAYSLSLLKSLPELFKPFLEGAYGCIL